MAEKTEFLQAIDDAILDADSLEQFINGSDSETVLTRLSAEYPTLQKALKELFENGGIAGRFKTLTDLQASSLVDGDYALVADDADDKNGIYIKEAGVWVKSKYDVVEQISDINKKISNNEGSDLFTLKDNSGKVVARVDSKSQVHLTDLDFSVQQSFENTKVKAEEYKEYVDKKKSKNLLDFTDNNNKVYAYFDENSELNLTRLKTSVQDKLADGNMDLSTTKRILRKEHVVADKVLPYMMSLYSGGKIIAPIPMEFTPLSWTLSTEALNAKVSNMVQIPIDTPYDPIGDGRVIHPTITQFRDTWNGYEYLMGLTPYRDAGSKWENPVVYGSNDLITFDMLNDGNHLADKPDGFANLTSTTYNSDIFYTYDFYTGELLCGWREYGDNSDGSGKARFIKARRTKDLKVWGDVEVLWDAVPEYGVLSPSIVFNFDTGKYDLYTMEGDSRGTNNRISRWTSDTLTNPIWKENKQIAPNLPNFKPWHIEVRYVGSALMCVMHYPDYESGDERNGNLWTGMSSDNGETWVFADSPLLTTGFRPPYKASVMPIYNDDGTYALYYMYAPNSSPLYLYAQKTTNLTY